jgi:hypothetical protein
MLSRKERRRIERLITKSIRNHNLKLMKQDGSFVKSGRELLRIQPRFSRTIGWHLPVTYVEASDN